MSAASFTFPAFTFVDLFAGIGGMRMAFEAAGGRCVFTSEWNPFARQTYAANFGETHPIAGDIREVEADSIPDHDVLLAGFPCQPFSIAGVSKKNALGRPHGFACATQGTLFFDVARIIAQKQPRAFLLENVKNIARQIGLLPQQPQQRLAVRRVFVVARYTARRTDRQHHRSCSRVP